ncbi:MAG TPA: hypothetical protein PKD61_27365, partial [Polyangiaceae bacterium]|nr:hypothetical protein [Polyangiaceae bacterium]
MGQASQPGAYGGGADMEASEAPSADSAAPSAPPSAGSSAMQPQESAKAETRPGLGTEWGENRTSRDSTAP